MGVVAKPQVEDAVKNDGAEQHAEGQVGNPEEAVPAFEKEEARRRTMIDARLDFKMIIF